MRRKVIQIGESTKLITLPAEYTRRWGICKGDELFVENFGQELRIYTDRDQKIREIRLTEIPSEKLLLALYTAGFDRVLTPKSKEVFAPVEKTPYSVLEIEGEILTLQVESEVQNLDVPAFLRRLSYAIRHCEPSLFLSQMRSALRSLARYGFQDPSTTSFLQQRLHRALQALEDGDSDTLLTEITTLRGLVTTSA